MIIFNKLLNSASKAKMKLASPTVKDTSSLEVTIDRLLKTHSKRQLEESLEICNKVRRDLSICFSLDDIIIKTRLSHKSGLCYMLAFENPSEDASLYLLVRICQDSWVFTTHDPMTPVPDIENSSRWNGHNLRLRKSLLDHLIYCLKLALREVRYE